jgi:hypothetical protein
VAAPADDGEHAEVGRAGRPGRVRGQPAGPCATKEVATYSELAVAWALTQGGRVTAFYVDGDSNVTDTAEYSGTFRACHPGSDPMLGAEAGDRPRARGRPGRVAPAVPRAR